MAREGFVCSEHRRVKDTVFLCLNEGQQGITASEAVVPLMPFVPVDLAVLCMKINDVVALPSTTHDTPTRASPPLLLPAGRLLSEADLATAVGLSISFG